MLYGAFRRLPQEDGTHTYRAGTVNVTVTQGTFRTGLTETRNAKLGKLILNIDNVSHISIFYKYRDIFSSFIICQPSFTELELDKIIRKTTATHSSWPHRSKKDTRNKIFQYSSRKIDQRIIYFRVYATENLRQFLSGFGEHVK